MESSVAKTDRQPVIPSKPVPKGEAAENDLMNVLRSKEPGDFQSHWDAFLGGWEKGKSVHEKDIDRQIAIFNVTKALLQETKMALTVSAEHERVWENLAYLASPCVLHGGGKPAIMKAIANEMEWLNTQRMECLPRGLQVLLKAGLR